MYRTEAQWIEAYGAKRALFIHSGNMKQRHPVLTSGKHSTGFFNSRPVTFDDELLEEAASDIVEMLIDSGQSIGIIDRVVGPATGATRLAEFIAKEITRRRERLCRWASPVKHPKNRVKSMVWADDERKVLPGEVVLLVEDVISTGGSVKLAERATILAKGKPLPIVVTLVNRSGLADVNGKHVIALIYQALPMWTPKRCLLCKAGSEPLLQPKDNWDMLSI